jgi:hypothetical protein
MTWYQALFTILLGNVIVLIPMVLNAHAGTKYGISFPVLCRASFGVRGANVAAMLRAIVACGWFGPHGGGQIEARESGQVPVDNGQIHGALTQLRERGFRVFSLRHIGKPKTAQRGRQNATHAAGIVDNENVH